jgi:tRNA (cmo5U34)-methyltransferase
MSDKNKTPFTATEYDLNIRKVIPMYDMIYDQIFDLIKTVFPNKKISLLDTGCGSGNLGARAVKELDLSELVLCDPSVDMLAVAEQKFAGRNINFIKAGSEELDFEEQFNVVTAIQSHNYFNRPTREKEVTNCFKALKKGGLFICFENTAPFSEDGKNILFERVKSFQRNAGRSEDDVQAHIAR